MTDEEIVEKWRQAVRMHSKPNQLAKLIALQMAEELEKDGVTEADIDRLLPDRERLTAAPASAGPTPAEIARSFWKGDGLPAGYASGWNDACETIARELESSDPCLVK